MAIQVAPDDREDPEAVVLYDLPTMGGKPILVRDFLSLLENYPDDRDSSVFQAALRQLAARCHGEDPERDEAAARYDWLMAGLKPGETATLTRSPDGKSLSFTFQEKSC